VLGRELGKRRVQRLMEGRWTRTDGPLRWRPPDNQIRIGAQQGRPPSTTQEGDQNSPNDRPHIGMEAGAQDDTFMVFHGGVPYPVDYAPVWTHIAKDGLKAPGVVAVEHFRKAVEESEKAAAQKQQQQQKKNP
jgi:hypothetical protein